MLRIVHGTFWNDGNDIIYRNTKKQIPNISNKFKELILIKFRKFRWDLYKKDKPLEFTFGTDKKTNISAIAIVHPKDNFSKKIGRTIVKGRIKRQKEGKKYFPLPQYIDSPAHYNF